MSKRREGYAFLEDASQAEAMHDKLVADKHKKEGSRVGALVFFLFGTGPGQLIVLVGLAVTLVVGGAFGLMTTDPSDDAPYDKDSFSECLWFSWGVFIDAGGHTALAASEDFYTKWVATLFGLAGFLFNLVVLGVLVDNIRKSLDTFRERQDHLVVDGHFLVLGWSSKTTFLLRELLLLLVDRPRGGTIVVMGSGELEDMEGEVFSCFPAELRPKNVKVVVKVCGGARPPACCRCCCCCCCCYALLLLLVPPLIFFFAARDPISDCGATTAARRQVGDPLDVAALERVCLPSAACTVLLTREGLGSAAAQDAYVMAVSLAVQVPLPLPAAFLGTQPTALGSFFDQLVSKRISFYFMHQNIIIQI